MVKKRKNNNIWKKLGILLLIGLGISIIFTFLDFWYHLIPGLEVPQPSYSINKFIITPFLFLIGFFLFKKIKSIGLKCWSMTLFITILLEIRYFFSYSIIINILFIVFHSIIVYILLRVVFTHKKLKKYMKNNKRGNRYGR